MTRPVSRIEVWEPGGVSALYTINDALAIYFREVLTNGVGNFNFAVYSHKDFSGIYTYPNIDLGDKVKIWLDYDAVAGNPNFIGKVTNRKGPLLTATGWVRKIIGLSQGEVLLRRFKKNKYYDAVDASVIVREWATDLGLESSPWKVEEDTTDVTLEVATKSYFDLLRWISDYWASASIQLKKDFWVDLDADLFWKVRPFRTSGVESFTTADFLQDPLVEREVETAKNNIVVYGIAEKKEPIDGDTWTEPAVDPPSDWTAIAGTVERGSASPKVGIYYIIARAEDPSGQTADIYRTITRQTMRNLKIIYFWSAQSAAGSPASTSFVVRILAPDASNYFEASLGTEITWAFNEIALGATNQKDAELNPKGAWTKVGSANWWNMQGIRFRATYSGTGATMGFPIDGLYLYPERWTSSASDATSISTYSQRDLEVTDDKLHSVSDCQKRAETLLYQLKDPPIQITVTVRGNDNVLVGDRLTITIPSEGITAQPYDVIAVENLLNLDNWTTIITMVNSVNWRIPLQLRQQIEMRRRIRELGMEEKLIA